MKVSVIIPSTDAKKAENTLKSIQLQEQTRADEIIIVGRNLQDLFNIHNEKVKVINEDKWINAATARNIGAKLAKGDILLFIDDDCFVSRDWINSNLKTLSENQNVGMVLGRLQGSSHKYFARCVDLSGFWVQQDFLLREVKGGYAASIGIRHDFFDQIGGFNSQMDMVEDCELCLRIDKEERRIIYNPEVLVYHNHKKDTLAKLISFMYQGGINYRKYFLKKSFNPHILKAVVLTLIGTVRNTFNSLLINRRAYQNIWLYLPGVFVGFLAWHWGVNRPPKVQKSLDTLIYFITSQCNLNCQHCFYWRRLNKYQDISLAGIKRAFKSFGKIHNLLLSGGEPFLRKDIGEVVQFFRKNNNIQYLSIPTNGSAPDIIRVKTEEILAKLNIYLTIGLSIDGREQFHDWLRGKKGSFKKAVETYHNLSLLKQKYSKLKITVNPVITAGNVDEVIKLAEFVKENMPQVDYLWPCIIRGNPKSKQQVVPQPQALRKINAEINNLLYKNKSYPSDQVRIWNYLYEIKLKALKDKAQLIPCQAGQLIGVLDANGDVRACELREPFGNIKNQDFLSIWNSHLAFLMRKSIKAKECYCTHECFIYPSLMKKAKRNPSLFLELYGLKEIFKNYLGKYMVKLISLKPRNEKR